MARTPSKMLALGTIAPDFNLIDTVTEKYRTLNSLKGNNGTVIYFICNHCPFVIHVNGELVRIANDYSIHGISFIAISSNDVINYPQDSPELMKENALNNKFPFPYLYDETQDVARKYDAACTPDSYVFNANNELIYRGQIDDSRPGNGVVVTGKDIRNAIECLITKKENIVSQKPSIGCGIKWKTS